MKKVSQTPADDETLSSNEKGAMFEDDVANLYRLLGAEVIQNIEISHKKVDVFATFAIPGSGQKHRVIIECKDEKKKVADNQRVMEFFGLLQSARKLDLAESAEIITRVTWSDAAKGFAKQNGIEVLTFTEKLSQLIDFKPYLKTLVAKFDGDVTSQFEEPPLGKYYIVPKAERGNSSKYQLIESLDNYLMSWAESGANNIAILGEYGTGKTSVCQKLARDLAVRHLNNPINKIPILLNLREFTKKLEIEALITSFLDRECEVSNPRFKLFDAMNKAGMFLLIFDAFDEMAVKVDRDTVEANLLEIERLIVHDRSKAVLTSRIEYFISVEEQEKVLHSKGNVIQTKNTIYDALTIKPWDEAQVNSFLAKRIPLISEAKHTWTYYSKQIKAVPELADLSGRPVLLEMIAKTLPKLIASNKRINRPNLYDTYLNEELRRQRVLKKRDFLLTKSIRFSMLEKLASIFFQEQQVSVSFSDAASLVNEKCSPPRSELEFYTRDFLACSFLVRKGDEYRFSHNSILEYLVAKAIWEEIKRGTPIVVGKRALTPVITDFLVEMKPDERVLSSWLFSKDTIYKNYCEGNAATVLCKIDNSALKEKNISGTWLIGADLRLADLRNTAMRNTTLHSVNLTGAKIFRNDLSQTNIDNIAVSLYICGEFRKAVNISLVREDILFLAKKLDKLEGVKIFNQALFSIVENLVVVRQDLQISSYQSIKRIENYLETTPWVKKQAIFFDDIQHLITRNLVNLNDSLRKMIDCFDVHHLSERDIFLSGSDIFVSSY